MTDSDVITVEWWYHDIHGRALPLSCSRHGVMEINCDIFFPATKERLTKLLMMNGKRADFSKPNIEKMLACAKAKSERLKVDVENGKVTWNRLYSELCDLKPQAKSGKAPSGVRLTDEEWKDAKKRTRELKRMMSDFEYSVKHCQRDIKQLQKNIEQIEGWKSNE